MHPYIAIVAACLSIIGVGCNIYKPYSRPAIPFSGLYRDSLIAGSDTNSIANVSWRDLFTDEQLRKLIDEALSNNMDLKAAMLSIEQSEAQLNQSRMGFFPSLSADIAGSIAEGNRKTLRTYSGTLNSSWEVDIFGKILNTKRAAKAAVMESEAYKCAVQTRLISNVAAYYYTLLMLDEQLAISQKTLENWTQNVETMELLKKTGIVNQAAVSQAKANRYGIETTIPELKRQIREIENSLSILLGKTPRSIERGKLYDQHLTATISTGVSSLLLAKRPDVQQAESILMLAYANTNVARSMFYPSLVLTASSGFSNYVLGTAVNPAMLLGSIGGGLTQPLFNRMALRTQLKVSEVEQQKALLAFEKTLLNAGEEVSNALFRFQVMESKTASRKEQIAALEESVRSTQELLALGSATYIEVLTAQQSLLAAQLNQSSDALEKLQSIVDLYAALGGGVK